jgi:nucleotide-binding universal stress UspA family protein
VDEVVDELAPVSFRHVLLPLDGSKFAAAAMPTARALAARFGAELMTISVTTDERAAERLRHDVVESLGEDADENRIFVTVATKPAHAITARAEELGSCVVCMSTRGRGRVAGTLMGSVTREVLQSSGAPVVAVGPQADRPPALVGRPRRRPASWPEPLSVGDVLACVDGSRESEAVLPIAARWATTLDIRLSIITVAEDAAPSLSGEQQNRFGPPDPEPYVDQLAERWRNVVSDAAAEVVLSPMSVASGLQTRMSMQPTALVAITTHARTGFDRIRLGSTAADIARSSTAPTLVVPLPDP